jgi:vacuolar-type H+-ATPase subunit I/STV1
MYNTQFNVKYNDIEEKLISKLNNKPINTNEPLDKDEDNDYEYTHQDVLDICNKLYHDELLSVFNVDCITDNNVEEVMKYVYDMINLNTNFKLIIDEITQNCIKEFLPNDETIKEKDETIKEKDETIKEKDETIKEKDETIKEKDETIKEKEENIRQISLIFLFSKDVFYITHKCICQQINLGVIDTDLLVDLKNKSADILKQL